MGAGDFWVGPRREGLGACAASGWVDSPDCVPSCVIPVFAQGLGRRFGAISGLNRQSGIRNVSGRNNARYAITLSYAFLSFLLELSYCEARRIAQRLEFHYTPTHGSWLNMAEIELSVFSRGCLNRRISDEPELRREVAALERERNAAKSAIDWRFTTQDARRKLQHIYPTRSD